MKPLRSIVVLALGSLLFAPLHAAPGIDSVSSAFFRDWYQTTDLGHYLDNCNPYTVYETETTGEWNLGDRNVFSIAGNSFRQTKYHLNGFRIDSRTMVGYTLFHTQMDRTSLALDYHDGALFFTDDSLQRQTIRLTGNVGNLGGISPGTKQLIHLFHTTASERTIDNRPLQNRNHMVGAGTVDATFAIHKDGRPYYQHVYAHYGRRQLTAFDHTGIYEMYDADHYTAQVDGELPIHSPNATLNYFLVAHGRSDYGSEFYYNANEQAQLRAFQVGAYSTRLLDNRGTLVVGLSYEANQLKHDSLSFSRNIMDQDGEGFEPWYTDGRTHSINLSVRYDQPLLSWLRVHVEGYNSLLLFRPTTNQWTNSLYAQSIVDKTPTPLYTLTWESQAFTSGLLENEALVIAEHEPVKGLQLYGHLGVSLDGIALGHGQSVISPNILAKIALDYQPVWWFRFGLSLSHHRMSYTWDEIRFLSPDYMNRGTTHTPDKYLWAHQPSYAVLDLPVYFTFGRSRRHEIAVLSSLRTYYHQWFTTYADGIEGTDYTVALQPLDLISSRPGCRTPYYASNLVRYTYNGRKWFVQLSWQSYLMSGFSALGNGPLSNNLGVLSESTADAVTFTTQAHRTLPYQANGRLNQDRAYIARIQVTYNACKYFSIGFNGKFKDGQPFTNYATRTNADGSVTILPYDARGINLANNAFGKRKDAFFNFELRATGRWWAKEIPMSLEVLCYNIYDFGTALTEYTFDQYNVLPDRTTMSLCIPRGLLFTLRVGLEKDNQDPHQP